MSSSGFPRHRVASREPSLRKPAARRTLRSNQSRGVRRLPPDLEDAVISTAAGPAMPRRRDSGSHIASKGSMRIRISVRCPLRAELAASRLTSFDPEIDPNIVPSAGSVGPARHMVARCRLKTADHDDQPLRLGPWLAFASSPTTWGADRDTRRAVAGCRVRRSSRRPRHREWPAGYSFLFSRNACLSPKRLSSVSLRKRTPQWTTDIRLASLP